MGDSEEEEGVGAGVKAIDQNDIMVVRAAHSNTLEGDVYITGSRKVEDNSVVQVQEEGSNVEAKDEVSDGFTSWPVSADDHNTATFNRYCGDPAVLRISSRFDVVVHASVNAEAYFELDLLNENEKSYMKEFPNWIRLLDGRLYDLDEDDPVAIRYARLGIVVWAAYDLAKLHSLNKWYQFKILKMLDATRRNEELMKEMEEQRYEAIENEKFYMKARSEFRSSNHRTM